ncbi:hypothetical protein [Nostoc sp. GT001]|uniref:hypothetical protein n=1 Tax=Nostoc sp. GT001 TaxID=3056647 RepID=UPI0025AA3BA0|nr:hypothetical protein [Nostoc sp. GT001]MDM9581070.1 hypothetical protein [Nostoc sp. GT001]
MLMFLPLSLAVLGPLPKPDISAGSGFYNLTRQLGGSIGIALLTTLLDRREAFHRAILLAKLSPYDPETSMRLDALNGALQGQGMDATTAQQQALALLSQTVDTQAAVLSYADCFRVVGVGFLCSLPLLLFLGKGGAGVKAPVGH